MNQVSNYSIIIYGDFIMLTSLDLANHFGFKILSGDLKSLNREITIAELDRPGLELLGLFQFYEEDRIMLIGNKEIALINESDPEFIYHNCMRAFSERCPAIVITQNNECPASLMQAAKDSKAPLFSSSMDTSELASKIYIFLSEALAPKCALHACLLEIYGVGVLLMGESGIGKSEIALDLIKKGHRLVADDRVDIIDVRGKLIGTCPESIVGMMEVRGIGIINVSKMFGVNALSEKSSIKLVIDLVQFDSETPLERIGMKTDHYDILNESVPLIKLPVSAARSLASIIETAVTNYKLKSSGYDTGYEFQKRLQDIQDRRREERRMKANILNEIQADKGKEEKKESENRKEEFLKGL